jgi:hypothetical protein
MAELVPLAEAARLLGVSVERARQLVVTGQLPGRRFGNAWAVPRAAIASRKHSPGIRGRPLGSMRAWEEIVAGRADLERPGRYRRRAEVVRCDMSRADADALPELIGAMVGGVRGAVELGEHLAIDDSFDLYLSARSFGSLASIVAFGLDASGRVALRVVNDAVWDVIPTGGFAPRDAVALDLLDSGDPRHWIAAEHLTANRG